MITANFSLFKIYKCGFYSKNGRTFKFGTINEVLDDLKSWVDGKPLRDTKTYDPSEPDALNPTYLCNIHKDNHNNWLVTTWNQTESTEAGVASIDGAAIVGHAEITISDIPEDGIPGFPTYFWILPDKEIIVSIRFKHLKTGLPEFRTYMLNYLGFFSKYVVMSDDQGKGEVDIVGYRKDGEELDPTVQPRFKTNSIQKAGALEEIRNNCENITKVTSKTVLKRTEQVDMAFWQKMLEKTGITEKEFVTEETLIKYDFRSKITPGELESMINNWEEHQRISSWYDYGFHIKGRQTPLWLSGSQARGEVELDMIWTDKVLNPATLAQALYSVRDVILNSMNNE